MAIDTAKKRRSLSGIQITLLPGVTPNTLKDQAWRQSSAWGYSGNLVASIEAVTGCMKVTFSLLAPSLVFTLKKPTTTISVC